MTVTLARDTIACPACGSRRIVTDRHARRSRAEGGIRCRTCRGHGPPASEQNLRFWLRSYGSEPPPGTSAREFIVGGGAPPELVDLARQCFPPH